MEKSEHSECKIQLSENEKFIKIVFENDAENTVYEYLISIIISDVFDSK